MYLQLTQLLIYANIGTVTVLDTIENGFGSEYAPWPFRFYGIQHGVMSLIGMPTDGTYFITEVEAWLETIKAK